MKKNRVPNNSPAPESPARIEQYGHIPLQRNHAQNFDDALIRHELMLFGAPVSVIQETQTKVSKPLKKMSQ